MKNKPFLGCLFLFLVLMSCATGRAARISQSAIEAQRESQMESAISRIKQNSQDIEKYYVLDDNKEIVVKAELSETQQGPAGSSHFEVIYDVKNMEANVSSAGNTAGNYTVPFTVTLTETGEQRQDTLIWKPQKDGAGILLSLDDDYIESWENNFDLFDSYNARVTFFLKGEFSPFCLEALQRGHDVGYHTINHLNLLKVSRETFDEETTSQLEIFRSAGAPMTTFGYPFGLYEVWMNEELLKSFRILRGYGVTFRAYDRSVIREGFSSSKALDNILFKRDEDFKATVDMMFRTVKFIGGNMILPLTTHDISDTADWGIKPDRLRYLLQDANDWQLVFYRYKDL